MQKRGFTVVEVIVVVAILAILLSIGFSLAAPAREQSRQSKCISQLKQVYACLSMYSADYDHGSEYPELQGLAYVPRGNQRNKYYLGPYGFVHDFDFCPSSTTRMRQRLGSSYVWPIFSSPVDEKGNVSHARQIMIKLAEQTKGRLPVVECHVHDEVFYGPSENSIDHQLASPHRIYLLASGQIYRGRSTPPRTTLMTDLSYQ